MLFREIISVYSENHIKDWSTFVAKLQSIWMLQEVVHFPLISFYLHLGLSSGLFLSSFLYFITQTILGHDKESQSITQLL
jgi:hypothetical protein